MAMTQDSSPTRLSSEGREYIIEDTFKNMFPAKSDEEIEVLREDIKSRKKLLDSLIGWDQRSVILDGHHRAKICEELGIKPPIQWLPFDDEDAAKMWMLQHQIMRRNLKTFQRVEAALQFDKFFADKARANRDAGVSLNSTEGIDTDAEVAKIAKTSPNTVWKVRKILDKKKVDEIARDIEALRNGDPEVSIHSVFTKCQDLDNANKTDSHKKPAKPSTELRNEVKSNLQYFASTVGKFDGKADRTYIFNEILEWVKKEKKRIKEQKAKTRATKKTIRKASKKASKKSAKKNTKKTAKKATKKSSKKK